VIMLRRFVRKYGTRDIMEEYRNILVCPLVDGWSVADDEWAEDIGGIPCPDWTKVFGFTAECKLLGSFGGFFISYIPGEYNADRVRLFARSAEEKESGGARGLHPRPRLAEGV
jgi:hypothetical protein